MKQCHFVQAAVAENKTLDLDGGNLVQTAITKTKHLTWMVEEMKS